MNHREEIMKKRSSIVLAVVLAAVVLGSAGSVLAAEKKEKPLIQMAILLDTSNSMDGLIVQAKSQLWKIVNEFTLAKRNGLRPEIQVALYEYGNDRLSSKEGYIRQVLPLTNDLDKVSEELFALTTNGGSEYCGQVIQVAARQLDWSKNSNDLKVVVIAGNEPFDQGPVKYRESCKEAIGKGVMINTIHCGSYEEGERTGWKDGAMLADGKYMNIDQDRAVVHIDAPQDKEIARLGTELNKTYLGYGSRGYEAVARQSAQDSNASSVAKGSMMNRAVFKASAQYRNDSWDLVDAVNNKSVKLEEVKKEELPEEMKEMSLEERKSHIEEQTKKRAEIREKVNELNEARKKFVAKKMKETQNGEEETLDSVMIKAMREQATKRSFKFE